MSLSPKHKAFCDEYLANGMNATQAYKSVYKVTDKVAGASAPRLLENVRVKEYLKQEGEKTAERLNITKEELLRDLQDIKNNNKENLEKCSTKENNLLRTKAVKNRALPTGVYLQTDGNGFSRYSSGYAKRDGKYKTKSFSCSIYGESQALAMAISWRKSMLEQEYPELNIPLIKDFSNLEKMDYRIYIVQNYHTNKVELITGDIIKAEEKINYNDELCIKFIDIDLMLLEEIH